MPNTNESENLKILRRKRKKLLKRKKQRRAVTILVLSVIFIGSCIFYFKNKKSNESSSPSPVVENEDKKVVEPTKVEKSEVLISIAGDCTLGTDDKLGYANSFTAAFDNSGKDYTYFMKNVFDLFNSDDYTFVNLETTLTESKVKAPKGGEVFFNFRGPKDYVNILTNSSIEGVTLSNNHIYDYGTVGFKDTVDTLESKGIDIAGEGHRVIKEIKGVKFGFLGYMGWGLSDELKGKISKDITELRDEGVEVIIPYFHWGSESQYEPNEEQKAVARFAIDSGADVIIGSHPHVMQSLENYKGKLIAYSMGNFCFGGNSNPRDKRTFILQLKSNFENGKLVNSEYKVVPTMISSRNDRNDYIPTIASDSKGGILSNLNELSPTLKGKISDEFFKIDNLK